STFVAGLELARQGRLALTQETLFGAIEVRVGESPDAATAWPGDHGAETVEIGAAASDAQ
ncbi:MAG: hypothetical protein JO157_07470, partial [Acetobacteraceae bacterium]|nr:hypothetical protein [Acetobacteraceae bacterium]